MMRAIVGFLCGGLGGAGAGAILGVPTAFIVLWPDTQGTGSKDGLGLGMMVVWFFTVLLSALFGAIGGVVGKSLLGACIGAFLGLLIGLIPFMIMSLSDPPYVSKSPYRHYAIATPACLTVDGVIVGSLGGAMGFCI